jgi:hypothetical protein
MKKMFVIPLSFLLAILAYYPRPAIASPNSKSTKAVQTAGGSVSERLHQEFGNSFPNAEKVNWDESDGTFVVSFVNKGMLNRIVYDKHGEFVSSLRNYGESELPYYLASSLKKKFPGQKIFGVTEITSISGIAYFVKLEGPKNWTTVSLDAEGSSFVLESYKKLL